MQKVIDLFWKTLSNATFFCFVAMLVLMIVQVFLRYAFRLSVPWTEETTRYFFIWAVFLGSALAQRNREHIRIEILVDRLSSKKQKIFYLLTNLFNAVICLAILIGTFRMMKSTYGIFASTIPMSFAYIYLALTLGIGIMLILFLRDSLKPLWSRGAQSSERESTR
jgi:TRAP-type C4-dicarboxylate transport system permease small subunit